MRLSSFPGRMGVGGVGTLGWTGSGYGILGYGVGPLVVVLVVVGGGGVVVVVVVVVVVLVVVVVGRRIQVRLLEPKSKSSPHEQ